MIFATSKNPYLSMACMFLSALLIPIMFAVTNGLIQVTAPQHMRARVLSALLIVVFGIQPFAALFIGYTANRLGSATAVLINGSLMLIGAVILLISRNELRTWEAKSPVADKVIG